MTPQELDILLKLLEKFQAWTKEKDGPALDAIQKEAESNTAMRQLIADHMMNVAGLEAVLGWVRVKQWAATQK